MDQVFMLWFQWNNRNVLLSTKIVGIPSDIFYEMMDNILDILENNDAA